MENFRLNSYNLRKYHIESFSKLSLKERLTFTFSYSYFWIRFLTNRDRNTYKKLQNYGKRYFKYSANMGKNNKSS